MRRIAILALAAALLLARSPRAEAGGSAETTIVVVNVDSPTSLRIANEYVRIRKLPPNHLVAIEGVPNLGVIGIEVFRQRIWSPIRAWLATNDPEGRIDTIAYSADFPYGVDFSTDKSDPQNPPITPTASLTSMTYLARRVEKKDAEGYLNLFANGYYRRYVNEESQTKRERTEAEADAYREAQDAVIEKRWKDAAAAFGKLVATYADDYTVWYDYGCCLALVGKPEEALAAVGKAVDLGYSDVSHTKTDPDLQSIRSRPEFASMLAKMVAREAEMLARGAGAQPGIGFSSRFAWSGAEDPVKDPGAAALDRYWLSTLLGYTGQWGNSVPEVLSCLESAAKSDGTQPKGTVYVCRNGDVRSTTREPRFEVLLASLESMGRKGVILSKGIDDQTGVLPVCREDVIGAVIGISDFDWSGCKSRFLPGAIAEHLTSFGAVFNAAGQTKCTAFIRAGAAGSSGAVYEPYALTQKFPSPHVHVFYAEGCSLAESFFQSVWGPYQLLVIGDPLARPYAHFAGVALDGLPDHHSMPVAVVSGTLALKALPAAAPDRPLERVELWVDGRYVAGAPIDRTLAWDTTKWEDGEHDLRLAAVEAHRVGTRSSSGPVAVLVANGKGPRPTLSAPKSVALDATLSLSGKAPGAKEVQILAGTGVIETVTASGGAWKVAVPADRLGMGTVTLQARAVTAAGTASRSDFVAVRIEAPATRKPGKSAGKSPPKSAPGLRIEWSDGKGKAENAVLAGLGGFGSPSVSKQVEGKLKGLPKSLEVDGEFEVKAAGLYQFDVSVSGAIEIEVDGKPALSEPKASPARQAYVLLSLEAGWHTIRIRLAPEGSSDFVVLLAGDQVAAPMSGAMLRHTPR